jgi:SAM-dependent methyltransferase
MDEDLYSDYVRREPHPRNAVYIEKWHGKLLKLALKNENSISRILEIGPGHGYFAKHCVSSGLNYEFVDTSASVFKKMESLGYSGHLGLLSDLLPKLGKYDMVYMSHVLEHSPSWSEARQLLDDCRQVLSADGCLVIISPDVLNWKHEFWNVDWSHGYPTSIRNSSQLCGDVGFSSIDAMHHRNGSSNIIVRVLFTVLAKIPHRIIDRVISPDRYRLGDGFTYSWKVVFGWRQIFIKAKLKV